MDILTVQGANQADESNRELAAKVQAEAGYHVEEFKSEEKFAARRLMLILTVQGDGNQADENKNQADKLKEPAQDYARANKTS